MTTAAWVILIIALAAIAVACLMAWKARNTKALRNRFGPETTTWYRSAATPARPKKNCNIAPNAWKKYYIRPLSREECDRFAGSWRTTQERFVDDPRGAVAEADRLVHLAMKERGYPIGGDFEEQAADLSVDHPVVVEHYRACSCHRRARVARKADTEDLRTAMKHYRDLFEDLLNRRVSELGEVRR